MGVDDLVPTAARCSNGFLHPSPARFRKERDTKNLLGFVCVLVVFSSIEAMYALQINSLGEWTVATCERTVNLVDFLAIFFRFKVVVGLVPLALPPTAIVCTRPAVGRLPYVLPLPRNDREPSSDAPRPQARHL